MKTSACRDGSLKNQPNLYGNITTTLSHHPYILCMFATSYTNMICVLPIVVSREGLVVRIVSGVCSGGCVVHFDAWRVSYVVGCCNVVAILSMADMVCLDCMQKPCSA